MRTSALVLWGSLATFALTFAANGCGGRAEIGVPNHVEEDGGSSGSSSGNDGSSSGFSGSSSGISGSSSGFTGSSSGIDGSSSGSSSGNDGSSSGFSGSSSGISGSSSGFSGSSSGVTGSSSGSSSGGSPNGSIYLEECAASFCAGQSFYAGASFYTTSQGNGGCTVTTSGACAYYACSTTTQPNGVSAGTITIEGPWLTTPVTMTPTSGTNLYQYMSSSPGFTAGQTLSVTASGNFVPAFGPETVVAPLLTELTSPAIATDGGTTIIPTASDLQITWSGGQPGATMILEAAASNGQNYTYCSWNGSAGQGTIPAATLQPFSGQSGYFIYGQQNVTSFIAGPFAISLTALPYTGGAVNFQ